MDSEQAAKNMYGLFMEGAYVDNVFQKEYSQKFITDLHHYLENPSNSPKTKFYSLYVIDCLTLGIEISDSQKRSQNDWCSSQLLCFFGSTTKYSFESGPEETCCREGQEHVRTGQVRLRQ